jgi:L-alanine-DL-glutamate epimerase-like enolase superfamily enzyme
MLAAGVQMSCGTSKPENIAKAIRYVEDAAQQGARLVCQEIFASGAADAMTITLARCGRFLPSKRIAGIAEAAGLSCNISLQHPAGVGTVAMCQFRASTMEVADVGHGAPAGRFPDDILREPIRFKDGVVHLPDGPGPGVEVEDAQLAKYAIPIHLAGR